MILVRNILILLFFILLYGCDPVKDNSVPVKTTTDKTKHVPSKSSEIVKSKKSKLLTVTQSSNIQQIKTLLKRKNVDINAKTENGITPLHIASFKGDTEIVRLLIQNGADTNADVRGWRALDIAKKKGYMEIVDLVNEANNWFLDAAKNGDLKLLKKLHRNGKGVPVTVKDAEGWTALHQAAVSSQNDRTKLHKLSVSNQVDITKFLIDNGVKPDEKDVDDWTPLMVASVNGHTDIVKTLIEKGADVNARDKNGMTALHGVAVNGYRDIAELLIEKGADVNAGDKNGMTPLKMAESVNRTDMIDFLIRHCAEAELEKEGQVEGLVKDALTNQPLSGTSIKVFQQGKLVKACVEKTGTNGQYAFDISEGHYTLEISSAGYIPATAHVDVIHNETITLTTLRQVPETRAGKGTATGQLLNAYNGKAEKNVTLNVRSGLNVKTGPIVATTKTNNQGHYQLKLNGGNYTIEARKNGYATIYFSIVSIGKHTEDNQNASITPNINKGEIRIVLTWGAQPLDLDAHLLPPNIEGKRHHIYFSSKGQRASAPYVQLDVDDMESYGPETITIYQSHPGIYHYYVQNYSGTPALTTSDAKVEIFSATGLIKSYNIPISGKGKYWQVFSYDSTTGDITTINTLSTES